MRSAFEQLMQELQLRSECRGIRVLLVAAHPDDEAIGATTMIRWVRDLHILHTTDGSPENLSDAISAGCSSRAEYAELRRLEMARALCLAGRSSLRLHRLEFADQACSYQLPELTRAVCECIRAVRPELIVTHSYEGGHPDHDATAFAVHNAVRICARESCGSLAQLPTIIEMTSYHNGPSGMATGAFLTRGDCREFVVELSDSERALKSAMLNCHQSQRRTLVYFGNDRERFRTAPRYDFSQAPHPGRLFYEHFNWGVEGNEWRRAGLRALHELHAAWDVQEELGRLPGLCV